MPVVERCVVLKNRYGLHARPINKFVNITNRYESKVTVIKDDVEVDGKSVLGMMLLAANQGNRLTIRAEGDDAEAVVQELEALIEARFDED
ncbi:MAG: HPr family phosphocarrier protein [Planctomycetota bacterium]